MLRAHTTLDLGHFLTYLSERQETIASNIANADTPGYKTRDVESPGDFSAALRDVQDSVVEVSGLAARNDGNNVSIDREARLLSENTMQFNLATQLLRGKLKSLRSAIQEGRA
ncbi:MAG TPA: flagellar basal body protein [Bryobacteraceae bacterium]|nr:flagellar basal body protein [Bryobacteraceae bacterium]